MSNKLEYINQNSYLLTSLLSLQSLSDSSEELGTEAVEEASTPAIQKLYEELSEPYNEDIKSSCEAAIASYMKGLVPDVTHYHGNMDNSSTSIEHLQKHVVHTLKTHLNSQNRIALMNDCRKSCTCCYVIPPYLVQKVYQIDLLREETLTGQVAVQEDSYKLDRKVRNLTKRMTKQPVSSEESPITIYNAKHRKKLPGQFVTSNSEGKQSSKKAGSNAKKVLKASRNIHQFWLQNFNLNSFDNKGTEIKSTVHFGKHFANAFWNGEQMVFGDGNQHINHLTQLSIIAHEFGHAVTGNKLNYEGEAGALNEHFSDVWGSLAEQFQKKQTADQASWLIGHKTIQADGKKYALRSMKSPGSAYDSPTLGKDPQPHHYNDRYVGEEDAGGVHINSGIPNKAFHLFAVAQGGHAWEKAGHLWYLTLHTEGLVHPNCNMKEFAQATICTALTQFPTDYKMHQDLVNAWQTVGLV